MNAFSPPLAFTQRCRQVLGYFVSSLSATRGNGCGLSSRGQSGLRGALLLLQRRQQGASSSRGGGICSREVYPGAVGVRSPLVPPGPTPVSAGETPLEQPAPAPTFCSCLQNAISRRWLLCQPVVSVLQLRFAADCFPARPIRRPHRQEHRHGHSAGSACADDLASGASLCPLVLKQPGAVPGRTGVYLTR